MTPTDKRHVRTWYWTGAALVFLILIIGGITRLTGAWMPISDWGSIIETVPPFNEIQWEEAFSKFQNLPEYRQMDINISLSEFRSIYYLEYIKRLAGLLLGFVLVVPFLWFIIKKKIDSRQSARGLILIVLWAGHLFLSLNMVQTGLTNVLQVNPYRYAGYILLTFLIFSLCVWFANELYKKGNSQMPPESGELLHWLRALSVVIVLQVLWGALLVGHHASHIYNTFPKMNQFWMPPELWMLEPWISNFFYNMSTVQWMHRLLATILGVMAIVMWVRTLQIRPGRTATLWMLAVFSLVLLQYAVGVFTLVYHVPVWLGVTHQALAMVLFGVVLGAIHHIYYR